MAEEEKQQQQAAEATEGDLLSSIVENTILAEQEKDIVATAMDAFVQEMGRPERKGERIQAQIVDQMIAEIDARMSRQLDEILHNDSFQKLESAWRGLKLVVDRTDFRENNQIELLNVSKEDLLNDFLDSPEIPKSGLYKTVYTDNYGVFGGEPVGAMIANYEFGPGNQDVTLLQYVSSVASMSHAPFIAAASPKFFGKEDFLSMPNLKDLKAIFEGPAYTKWRGLRESEDSRYLGLTLPRFLLRVPYDPEDNPVKAFNYNEDVSESHHDYCWGNAAYAFATRLTNSFAKYRWCPNIIGPRGGGAVENLPIHTFEMGGEVQAKIPTEILLSERREFELAEEGFIGLTMRKDSDNACFFSANSIQKPKYFGDTPEGREAETNYKLGTQLPYMFVVSRLAHYIKVLQRENIGSAKARADIERDLNDWIKQYISDMPNPKPAVRARKPLRKAQIAVEDVPGNPGWYKVDMKVVPHMRYMGADFTLSLVGKLDQD